MSNSSDEHDEEEAKSLVSEASSTGKKKKKSKGGLFKRKKKNDDNDDSESIATATISDIDSAEAKYQERVWPFGNRPMSMPEKMTIGAGTVGAITSIGTIVMMSLGVVTVPPAAMMATFVAGGAAVVSVPHAIHNQAEIATMGTFRDMINQVRDGVNKFSDENGKLTSSVDHLLESVDALKELEDGLREIANKQGMQLDELNALIAENKRINKEMMKCLKASALQRIFSLLIECDVDGDYKLSGTELNRFAMGLTSIEDMPIDTEELIVKLKEIENFDLPKFMALIQDLLFDEDEVEEEEGNNEEEEEEDMENESVNSLSS